MGMGEDGELELSCARRSERKNEEGDGEGHEPCFHGMCLQSFPGEGWHGKGSQMV